MCKYVEKPAFFSKELFVTNTSPAYRLVLIYYVIKQNLFLVLETKNVDITFFSPKASFTLCKKELPEVPEYLKENFIQFNETIHKWLDFLWAVTVQFVFESLLLF